MRLLELFSGTGSMGRAFRDLGWEVVSLDIMPGQHTIRADIRDWDYSIFPVGHFDAIHASPPCTEYSIARTCAKTPRNLELADSLVQRTLDIIDYFKPKVFMIENPYTGMLRKRPLMQHLEPFLRRVTYCRYGLPYRKETAIWTNLGDLWQPRPLCTRSNPCPQVLDFWRPASAQNRDRFTQNRFKREELYVIPAALCDELALATEAFLTQAAHSG
jgi:site-specific DNA-cytosine methylase